MSNIKTFYDSDIALIEHALLKEAEIGDWRPEDLQFYLMGVHAMADQIILAIKNGEGF